MQESLIRAHRRWQAADRPVLKVFVHISGCDGLYASAGEPPRKINEPLVTFLTELAGYDAGYPDPRAIR